MARRKGHPNYFTNFDEMKLLAEDLGGVFCLEHFFERRGDFAEGRYLTNRPGKFYEWCVFLKKCAPAEGLIGDRKISSRLSSRCRMDK
jgi:hypothetical protein